MEILSLETSCDETAAAVVSDGTKVLSSVVASSEALHQKYGGIVPEVAAREQVRTIIPVIHEALERASVGWGIDAIAVTYGPGLVGSLLVGVETAKALSWVLNKPLLKVNHLLAHIYGAFLISPDPALPPLPAYPRIEFPFVALVVSGGHTDLLLMKGHTTYRWLGGTRDDAAGEAFDKAARLLGLGYPGGPAIAKAALSGQAGAVDPLPRPLINSPDLDFSFSGLKTALLKRVSYPSLSYSPPFPIISPLPPLTPLTPEQVNLAYEFQEATTDTLTHKTILAGKKYNTSTIVLCGGVSANICLREKLSVAAEKEGIQVLVPDFKYSTDNAAMVGSRAFFAPSVSLGELTAEAGLNY